MSWLSDRLPKIWSFTFRFKWTGYEKDKEDQKKEEDKNGKNKAGSL